MRRDLRLHDHAALHAELNQSATVQPIFIFDPAILERFSNPKDRRLSFLAERLCVLHQELQPHGGGMVVLYGNPTEIIPKLTSVLEAERLVAAEDYEPHSQKRDKAVREALGDSVACDFVQDHVVLSPKSVLKDDGGVYRVFTPYSKRWRSALTNHHIAERRVELKNRLPDYAAIARKIDSCDSIKRLKPQDGAKAMLEEIGYETVDLQEWDVDRVDERVKHFITKRLGDYKDRRDTLADDGTSKLSPYLRFGLVSARELYRLANERPGKGSDGWINELIWREFYQQILFHFPESIEQEFQENYRGMNWPGNEAHLQAWKDAKTGYPVVDAAMRQLRDTGWMHNRARMIVASFFTKDLLLDWRLGEEHFAQYLMDYELASNVGGWQWAASTGTDAQPYFRIFNPELQSKRFDEKAEYIKRYLPELRECDPKDIHALHRGGCLFKPAGYPDPVVDHKAQKDKAIAMFKQAGQAA